ncbi:MAG: homocysteine S-methyltransferase family protein [Ruminiclostridium sp.]
MNFLSDIKEKVLIFDGSMGTMLQKNGLPVGTCPEQWNITHPEIVKEIYKAYREAGSDVIQSNTFQSNSMKLSEYGIRDQHYEINYQGVKLAKDVMGEKGYVAASIGSLGKLLEPFGELTFDAAYETFREQVIAVRDGGADIISFETFTDISEMRIALLAAKENCKLPVICSISYEQNGKTLMGTKPGICANILHSLGADLIGTNCSFGASHMLKIAESYAQTGLNFSIKPNAGLPETINGEQVYVETPKGFAQYSGDFIKNGARLIGGCCGTNPQFIAEISKAVKGLEPANFPLNIDFITSSSKAVAFSELGTLEIGRIDVNMDEGLKKALKAGNLDAITDAALELLDEEYGIIIINADFDGGEDKLLSKVVNEAQTYLKQPFVLKSNNAEALAAALRIYKGRAGVLTNVNNETAEVIKKYGAVNVGSYLTNEI